MNDLSKKIVYISRFFLGLRSLFNIILIFFICLTAIIFLNFIGGLKDNWFFVLVIVVFGIFLITINIFGLKIALNKKLNNTSSADNPFVGSLSDKVETKRNFSKTTLKANEKIIAWLAPVDGTSFSRANFSFGKEVISAPENVLILTDRQIIGIALTEEDLSEIKINNPLIFLAQSASSIADSASERQSWFLTANINIFPKFMKNLDEEKLSKLLSKRWNFGIDLKNIKKIEPKKTFFNSGIKIYFENDHIYNYKTIWKDQIDNFLTNFNKISLLKSQ